MCGIWSECIEKVTRFDWVRSYPKGGTVRDPNRQVRNDGEEPVRGRGPESQIV